MHLYLLMQGGYFFKRRLIFCFPKDKEGSEHPSCTGCILSNFNSEQSVCQSGIFGGGKRLLPYCFVLVGFDRVQLISFCHGVYTSHLCDLLKYPCVFRFPSATSSEHLIFFALALQVPLETAS